MLGLCNFRAPPRLLVECKTRFANKYNRCSNMYMLLQFKRPYLLFVSTTSHTSLLKEVCVIGVQQMDLLKSSRIKHLEHL
jgi:hypothetical protein